MAVIGTAGWVTLGSTVLGGMMSDSGGGASQTATKEPWAEAAPWLKNQIAQGQQLQNYYQKNPFNSQQQTAYQNTFNDLDNFRNQTAPGLMNFANNAMTGSYQRPGAARPGMGAGYGGAPAQQASQLPGGLLGASDNSIDGLYKKYLGRAPEQAGAQYWQGQFGDSIDASEVAKFQQAAQPEIGRSGFQPGPFGMAQQSAQPASQSVPLGGFGGGLLGMADGTALGFNGAMAQPTHTSSNYGRVDFNASNPFSNGGVTAKATPDPKTVEQMVAEELARQNASRPMGDPWQGGSA